MTIVGDVMRTRRANGNIELSIWSACPDCGKERWVAKRYKHQRCISCGVKAGKKHDQRGPLNPSWKGGRHWSQGGYIWVRPYASDPCEGMATKDGYVPEHRLVMARHLGRPLTKDEIVHHKNFDKTDNRIKNLEITNRNRHQRVAVEAFQQLAAKVEELERQVRLLKWQNTHLLKGQLPLRGCE